jgi:hypothetical protein
MYATTKRNLIRELPAKWVDIHGDGDTEVVRRLMALDTENCTEDEVDLIVSRFGRGYVANNCSSCERDVEVTVTIGVLPEEETTRTAHLCLECLEKAVDGAKAAFFHMGKPAMVTGSSTMSNTTVSDSLNALADELEGFARKLRAQGVFFGADPAQLDEIISRAPITREMLQELRKMSRMPPAQREEYICALPTEEQAKLRARIKSMAEHFGFSPKKNDGFGMRMEEEGK